MVSSTASLISSMAPDASGLDKIIGIPPGTQMFYGSMRGAPHASFGGYGLAENNRYSRQVGTYLDQLGRVNDQRMGIAHNLLQNEQDDSKRKMYSNILETMFKHGLGGGLSPDTRNMIGLDSTNPAIPAMLDTSDDQALAAENADQVAKLGSGIKDMTAGGYKPPTSIAQILQGSTNVIPTSVAAASAGNSGGGAGGPGGKVTVTDNGIVRTLRHTMNAADLPTFLKNNPDTNLMSGTTADGTPAADTGVDIGMGNNLQKAAVRQMSSTGKVDIDPNVNVVDDGILQVSVGAKGQAKRLVFLDQQGTWHNSLDEAKIASGDNGADGE